MANELSSFDISKMSLEELRNLCDKVEFESNKLDKQTPITSGQIKHLRKIEKFVSEISQLLNYLEITKHPNPAMIKGYKIKLVGLKLQYGSMMRDIEIGESLKRGLETHFNSYLARIVKHYINNWLPAEIRDSIDLIEKTLAEPKFCTLPNLIMWRETAEEKIKKIETKQDDSVPQLIDGEIVKIYNILIKKLKSEILKLRTYPIPEPWCSKGMQKGLIHMLENNFIFPVHPELMEEMRPLKLSDWDLLPGGISREEYDSRLKRMENESETAVQKLKNKAIEDLENKLNEIEKNYQYTKEKIEFAFKELALLYRDIRTLEFLVDKNEEDKLLKIIHELIHRQIRHFYHNRIDIPSVAINYNNTPVGVSPPRQERSIPVASGVDRGATDGFQLVTPGSVVVIKNTVIVADRYGHLVSWYRAEDLAAMGSFLHRADTPMSMALFHDFLYVCYSKGIVQYRLTWEYKTISRIDMRSFIRIQQACCIAANKECLYVGTNKPCIILMKIGNLHIKREFALTPIKYTENKNRYPWLQDMKALSNCLICLFTGSPSPLQIFSLKGELLRSIITEDKLSGAYHFDVFINPITSALYIYVTDFWENIIKVFNMEGELVDIYCGKGTDLCQLIHPTGIFVEPSGYVNICDMKEDNCLQRL